MSTFAEQPADPQPTPIQAFGTTGIKPLERPSLITRFFMATVAFVERLNLAYSKVGNPPIYDNAVFPWTKSDRARLARDPRRTRPRAHAQGRTTRLP